MTEGLCECGCGQRTRPAPGTDAAKGWIKGRPLRFVRGHHKPPAHHGSANNRFNGGLCFDRGKRRWVIVCRDGTLVAFYRGVLAAKLGRLLRPDEIVHHVNGDSTDDRVENLLVTTRAEHMAIHREELRHA